MISPLYIENVDSDDSSGSESEGLCHINAAAEEIMRDDLELQSAWNAFCQSSSLSVNERGEYLNKFLCLLLETTPSHIPAINRLNFSKHQVISSYIGSHFLVELENLCQNVSFACAVNKDESEGDQLSTTPPKWVLQEELQQETSALSGSLKEHRKHSSSTPSSTSSLSVKSAVGSCHSNFAVTSPGSNDQSETSLFVHHSEESASSSFRTVHTGSSARSEQRKRSTRRDTLQFPFRGLGGALLSEIEPNAQSSDRGSERTAAEEKRDDLLKKEESVGEKDVPCGRNASHSFSSSANEDENDNSTLHGGSLLREEELMASIKEFLTNGRGARMLMVLDQIGAVGTTVGYEVVKFLGYIFECLLEELLKEDEVFEEMGDLEGNSDGLSTRCHYQPMIQDIKLNDIFKPILYPRAAPPNHPTVRVEACLNSNAKTRLRSGSAVTEASSRRVCKRTKRRRDSQVRESKVDSEEEGEKMRKQYVQYKKTLQNCECFHPDTLMKLKSELEEKPESFEKRPTTLRVDQLLDVILSVIAQFSLYDPFSNSVDHYSDKCARRVIEFSFKMLMKLSGDLSETQAIPVRLLQLLRRFSVPLIKIVFSGCQKLLKSASLFVAFKTLNVPENLFHFVSVLLDTTKQCESHSDSQKLLKLWLVNTLGDIVLGVASILKSVCCERDENTLVITDSFPMSRFFIPDYIMMFRNIFYLSLDVESEQKLVIIQSFGSLVLYLKVLKEDYFHRNNCEKSVHRLCHFSPLDSHHFSHFDVIPSSPKDNNSPKCLVSMLVKFLLSCFQGCSDTQTCLGILRVLSKSGFCCCMTLSTVLPLLLMGIERRAEKCQHAITAFIESVVWPELDCLNVCEPSNCLFCTGNDDQRHSVSSEYPLEHHLSPIIAQQSCGRWSAVAEYAKYIFTPTVGPLLTDHLAKLIRESKEEVITEINDKLLIKNLKTLVINDFQVNGCSPTTSASITENLIKCCRLSYSRNPDSSLQKLITEKGLHIIDHCKKNSLTRFEAFHLLCVLVDQEQKSMSKDHSTSLNERTPNKLDTFSRYYLTEIERHESFWMQHFSEHSLHVRKKANIQGMPAFHFSRQASRSFQNDSLPEESEEDATAPERASRAYAANETSADLSPEEIEHVLEEKEEPDRLVDLSHKEKEHVPENQDQPKKKHIPVEEKESQSFTNESVADYGCLVEEYSSVADLWQLTSQMILRSHDFLAFIANTSVCDIVAHFLINIIQDYARASNNLLDNPSVVHKNLGVTLTLCRSLLITIILCFHNEEHELEKPLEELRHHILRISSSNCDDIRLFISMLLQCSLLSPDRIAIKSCNKMNRSRTFDCLDSFNGATEESSTVETDGYDADTENNPPKRSDDTFSASDSLILHEDGKLHCPELLLFALDLIISHHQRYLEAKEFSVTDSGSKGVSTLSFSSKMSPSNKTSAVGTPSTPYTAVDVTDQSSTSEAKDNVSVSAEQEKREENVLEREEPAKLGKRQEKVLERKEPAEQGKRQGKVLEDEASAEQEKMQEKVLEGEESAEQEKRQKVLEGEEHGRQDKRQKKVLGGEEYAEQEKRQKKVSEHKSEEQEKRQKKKLEEEPAEQEEKSETKSKMKTPHVKSTQNTQHSESHKTECSDMSKVPGWQKDPSNDPEKSTSASKSSKKRNKRKKEKRRNQKKILSPTSSIAEIEESLSSSSKQDTEGFLTSSQRSDASSIVKEELKDINESKSCQFNCEEERVVAVKSTSSESAHSPSPRESSFQNDKIKFNTSHTPTSHISYDSHGNSSSTSHAPSFIAPNSSTKHGPCTSSSHTHSSGNHVHSTSSLSSFLKPYLCTAVEDCHITVLSQTLHDILVICKGSEVVCTQVQRLSFLKKLLDGFGKLIQCNEPAYEELIVTITNLWCEVAQHHLEATELSQYLGLFKASNSPINTLVSALCKVFDNGGKNPHFALRFPNPIPDVPGQRRVLDDHSSKGFMTSLTSLTSFVELEIPVSPAAEAITDLRNSHVRRGVRSCLSVCSLACPVPRFLDWSLYSDGVSVATWVSLQRRRGCGTVKTYQSLHEESLSTLSSPMRTRPNNNFNAGQMSNKEISSKLHLLSIGTQHLMFSVWVYGCSGNAKYSTYGKIYVSASSLTDEGWTVLNEIGVEKVSLRNEEWHHLALVLSKINVRKGGPVTVTLLLDGLRRCQVQLYVPPISSIKKSTPFYLTLGHGNLSLLTSASSTGKQNEGTPSDTSPDAAPSLVEVPPPLSHTLSMGLVYVFREPILTMENCFGLISLGKNPSSLLVVAPQPHKTVFAPLINRKLFSSNIDCSFLFKDLGTLLAPLQENLLLQYSPHNSTQYIYYKKSTPIHPNHTGSPYPVCVTQEAILFNPVNVVEKKSPELALLKLGGASQLAFLVARIAELGNSQKNFADCISLVFRICQSETNIGFQFSIFGGPSLVCRIIMAPMAPSGILVLKALMEACIKPSVIQFEACRNMFVIAPHIPAYIVDRGLLETILDNWKCFLPKVAEEKRSEQYVCHNLKGKKLSCIGIILSLINVLLQDSCPYRKFNLIQLNDIGALRKVIEIFEELKAEGLPLENICSPELIVDVISLLLGGKSRKTLFSRVNSYDSSMEDLRVDHADDPLPENDTDDQEVSSLGLVMPELKGEDVKEVGYFLLFLHPDEFTYVNTDKRNAFYLTHQLNAAKTVRAFEGKRTSAASFRGGNKAFNSKFSRFSLQGDSSKETFIDSSPESFDQSIEEGEEAISSSIAISVSPIKGPTTIERGNATLCSADDEMHLKDPIGGTELGLPIRCSSPIGHKNGDLNNANVSAVPRGTTEKVEDELVSEFLVGPTVSGQSDHQNLGNRLDKSFDLKGTRETVNLERSRKMRKWLSCPDLQSPELKLNMSTLRRSVSAEPCLFESIQQSRIKQHELHNVNQVSDTDMNPLATGTRKKVKKDVMEQPSNREEPCNEAITSVSPSPDAPPSLEPSNAGGNSILGESSGETSATMLQLITVGLLNAVEDLLQCLSQTQAAVVIGEMFSIDLVVLFTNHPSIAVRAAALGLFRTMLLRSRKEYCSFHIKRNIVHIISLQLHKHLTSSEALIAEAFALALKVDMKLDDVSVKDVVLSPSHKFVFFVPLFAILPSCITDIPLCHNTLTTFLHTLKMNEDLLIKIYLKTHFIDSLLLTVRTVLHGLTDSGSDAKSHAEAKLIIEDVTEILRYFIHQLVTAEGNAPFTTCREILCHVNFFYRRECDKCGFRAPCVFVFMDMETALLDAALYQLRKTSINVANHQSQFIMLPPDSTSSTNSDEESMKHNQSKQIGGGLRMLSHFFQRTPYAKEGNRSLGNTKRSPRAYGDTQHFDPDSPTEISPAMQRMTLNNLAESYKCVLQLCVHFVILAAHRYRELRLPQERFALSLLEVLYSSVRIITEYESSYVNKQPESLEYLALSCATIAENFWRLLTHLVSPEMAFNLRVETLHVISQEPEMKMIFKHCIKSDMALLYRLGIFIHELRYKYGTMDESTKEEIDSILVALDECGVITLPPPEAKVTEWTVVKEEKRRWHEDKMRFVGGILQQNHIQNARYLTKPKLDLAHEQIVAEGNRMSWQLLEIQNERLKAALKRVKDSQCRRIKFTYCWRDIVDLVTHEKAPWYFPDAFPSGWKLDATEGPMRIRKRLLRSRLNISSKFFHPYYAERHNKTTAPLQSLLVDTEIESALSHIIESINEDEKLVHTCHASFVAPTVEQKGEFLISHKNLYYIGEENSAKNSSDTPTVISKFWPMDVVREIHLRRYRLKDCAIELFSTDGQSALLAFQSEKDRKEVMDILSQMHFPNLLRETSLSEYTAMWREGVLSNFEYLTQLNKLAGRSFNDLMQYPIFPFILSDYLSKFINIEDPSIYRNLKKPIPIQKEEREEHFKKNFEASKFMCPDGPYHYGSHYSNSGIVLYYLIRLPPFTQLFLEFQDGNFDVPDRSFHTLETTWRLAASESTTAIRELIPEFFFLPEAFSNTQGFKFGVRQNGEMVNHVNLPHWCHKDPRKFVLVHRALLESSRVTQHLQHWVDLVFGYKQTGKPAIEAINMFHPATYFGFDVEIDSDELTIEARRTMIKTYGQTPRQLLTYPHPSPSMGSFPHFKTAASPKNEIPQVLNEVCGIPWGLYAGSPADPRPTVQLVQSLQMNVNSMMIISTNEVVLLCPNTVVHTVKSKKAEVPSLYRYIISWNHNDGIIRCRRHKSNVVYPLISIPPYNKVMCCTLSQKQLWLGTDCGQVLVYLVSPLHGKGGELVANTPNHPLIAHNAAVSCLSISHDFKVCFSGGEEGTVVLWDTNRLSYIRSVTVMEAGIRFLAVSETLGDWVSVTYSSKNDVSVIRYYTINAEFIESVHVETRVTSVTFSNAPEGRNVNVIAVGASDHAIRLFSTWDLSLVRVLQHDRLKESPICLLYTSDNYHLCAITENQTLVVWETSLLKCKMPKFITIGGI